MMTNAFDDPFFLEDYDEVYSTPKPEVIMTEERIAELQNFKTTDFTDCPVQTREQLRSFRPRYAGFIRLDADILVWLQGEDSNYQNKANSILRHAMAQGS
jgi:uncharacterized protein (DUF4415 family)